MGGVRGAASDISSQAKEVLRLRETIHGILVKHTGQPLDKIEKDTDRDYFMSAEEAKVYGVLDEVIYAKPKK